MRMKKQNQQIKFPSNNETFECKNCGKHVLFDHAIDHASECVRIQQLRKDCDEKGINLTIGLGPSLLSDLTDDVPKDFQHY